MIRANETMMIFTTISLGIVIGFFIGVSFSSTKLNITSDLRRSNSAASLNRTNMIWVPSNPKGAESLPPGIVVSESDFYLRRLWGEPSEDLRIVPNYLVAFTVGYEQRHSIDAAMKKFSENFTIVLFHYDGRSSEWEEFEWSKRAIHVSAREQTKWWYAKRFLHPDIVAPYEYIFVWDEDLGLNNFDAEKYINIVKKYGLEISQPAQDLGQGSAWRITKRRPNQEVHKESDEPPGQCKTPRSVPCAGFVEIQAPVFSRAAWRCTWHLIQNDLVTGWGLDLAFHRCAEPSYERMGVVDDQWIIHQGLQSLGSQGKVPDGRTTRDAVRQRSSDEAGMFEHRMEMAEKSYFQSINSTQQL